MSLFPYLYLLCALFCLILASFVLGRHEKSPARDAFLVQVFLGFVWQIGTYFVMTAPTAFYATVYSRLAYLGCIFLSVATYHLVVNLLNLTWQKKIVRIGYVFGALLFYPLLFTDYLLTDAYQYSWGFWFHAGTLHPVFLIYFGIFSLLSFLNLLIYSVLLTDQLEQQKCRFLFWANLILYFSVLDFFPNYGLSGLPLGFLFVDLWLFAVWFVIKLYDSFYMWKRIVQ